MPVVAILILIILKNVELERVNRSVGMFIFVELMGIELLLLPLALYVAVRVGRVPSRTAAHAFLSVAYLQVMGWYITSIFS